MSAPAAVLALLAAIGQSEPDRARALAHALRIPVAPPKPAKAA